MIDIGQRSRVDKERRAVEDTRHRKTRGANAVVGILTDEDFRNRTKYGRMIRWYVEIIVAAEMQVAAAGFFVVPRQSGDAAGETVAAAGAQRVTELVLSRAQIRRGPRAH